MVIEENGAIIGNWKKETWEPTKFPGIEQFTVSGKGMTLSFMRIKPEAAGIYAPTPDRGHRHDDVEQLTMMLEGQATVIVDGRRYPVKKGSHWLAPIGVDHTLDLRESPEGVVLLQIFPGPTRPAL